MRVAIVQARGLAIMDKNLLSKGGSSDPFVEVALSSAKKTKKTAVKKKTLEPVFHEQFLWSVSPSSSGEQPSLTLNVQDWDAVSKNDPMGKVTARFGVRNFNFHLPTPRRRRDVRSRRLTSPRSWSARASRCASGTPSTRAALLK